MWSIREVARALGGGDPVVGWLEASHVYDRFCQRQLVGKHCQDWFGEGVGQGAGRSWHHPGNLYINLSNMKVAFGLNLSHECSHSWSRGCMYTDVKCLCPREPDIKHAVNEHIVAGFCGTTILVLGEISLAVQPAFDLRPHQPRKGPIVSKQGRWRNDFDSRPLQQHRLDKSWVDYEVGCYLDRTCMRMWRRSRYQVGEVALEFGRGGRFGA